MMEYDPLKIPQRVSKLSLLKESNTLIFNDRFKILFKHRTTFLLIWTVCRCLKTEEKYKELGGVPPADLQALCGKEGYCATAGSINTRWYDEVRLKRHKELAWHLYGVIDLQNGNSISGDTTFLELVMQLIFPERTRTPMDAGFSKNTKLYTVSATAEQIELFSTIKDAVSKGYNEYGVSKITGYRYDTGVVGFIDWRHKAYINIEGTSASEIYVKMINLSSVPLTHYALPLWSDSKLTFTERNICAYTLDKEPLYIEAIVGGEDSGHKVEFAIIFKEAVRTGQIVDFCYCYTTPHTYKPGSEYFEWYFGQPHDHYQVELKFDKRWTIKNPVVYCSKDEDWFAVQQVSKCELRWERYFPRLHGTYRMEFGLDFKK